MHSLSLDINKHDATRTKDQAGYSIRGIFPWFVSQSKNYGCWDHEDVSKDDKIFGFDKSSQWA
jgi:hypothetical protein